ncbi:DUF1796 family putative cysteine peptidase [Paenibacillus sp. NPDC056579]|uniref:DUF1796 family putative cysteine peptidase n=1 Tax=Paenibacillus sp. NPDC056579 TaxID=3345871 RepID=UPI00369BFA31
MILSDLKKHKFDVIYSIGAACQTTHQLQENGLRDTSGPFDWFVLNSASKLTKILENEFRDFMLLENLEIVGEHDDKYHIRDKIYDCESVHDFPINETISDTYSIFTQTLKRRINRFIDRVTTGTDILLVRSQIHQDDINSLLPVLYKLNKNITVLAVNYSTEEKVIDKDWPFENVCAIDMPHPPDRWQGCDKSWGEVLSYVQKK